jgi:hypothetical protein
MGEKITLRLVAQYADACNLFVRGGVDLVQAKLDILKKHCAEVGRDYNEIEKTTLGTVFLAPDNMTPQGVVILSAPWPKSGYSTPYSICQMSLKSGRWRYSDGRSSRVWLLSLSSTPFFSNFERKT